jgi:hypothetical protein
LLPLLLSVFLFPSTAAQAQQSTLLIISNSGTQSTMELRASQENADAEIVKVESFALDLQNVLSVPANGYVTVSGADPEPLRFTAAKISPATTGDTVDIPIEEGTISFVGILPGVYTLDVIVDSKYAYECIVVIGQNISQVQQIINTQITEINSNVITNNQNFQKGKIKKVLDREEVCRYTPDHPICAPDEDGNCGDGFNMNEDGQCFPDKPCPPEYARPNDDETGACVLKEGNLDQCKDGSWKYISDSCYGEDPTPTPPVEALASNDTEPITCEPGFVLENGACAELNSFCGVDPETQLGVPCTSSDKENSTTENPIPAEPETTDSEETVAEIEENEEEESNSDDNNGDGDNGDDNNGDGDDNDSDNENENDNDSDDNDSSDNDDDDNEDDEDEDNEDEDDNDEDD